MYCTPRIGCHRHSEVVKYFQACAQHSSFHSFFWSMWQLSSDLLGIQICVSIYIVCLTSMWHRVWIRKLLFTESCGNCGHSHTLLMSSMACEFISGHTGASSAAAGAVRQGVSEREQPHEHILWRALYLCSRSRGHRPSARTA